MVNKIKEYWEVISQFGTSEPTKLGFTESKIRLMNQFCIMGIVGSTIVLLFCLIVYGRDAWLGSPLSIFVLVVALVFSARRRPDICYFISCYVFGMTVGLQILLFGGNFGEENILMALAVMTFVFSHGRWKLQFSAIVFIVSIYFLTKYYTINYGPITSYSRTHTVGPYIEVVINIMEIGICLWVILHYLKELDRLDFDRKRLIEQITNKNLKLSLLTDDLEQFINVTSHDLKSPLRNISTHLELLNRHLKSGDNKKTSGDIRIIKSATLNMYNLIEGLLKYRKSYKRNSPNKKIDLNEIFKIACMNLHIDILEKNALLQKDNLPMIYGDGHDFITIFQNLLSNGLKFNKSEQPEVTVEIENGPHFFLF